MHLYQVCAVFADGIRYIAVEADTAQEAKARTASAYSGDDAFYYVEDGRVIEPMDALLTKEDHPLPGRTRHPTFPHHHTPALPPYPTPPAPSLTKEEIASIHRALNCQYYYLERSLSISTSSTNCLSYKADLAAIRKLRDALWHLQSK